jgi:hypothetical protein
MAQMTWRGDEELLERVRRAAVARGWSVNRWVTQVFAAATDPGLAGTEAERVRERLAAAGLLDPPQAVGAVVLDRNRVAQARRAAGQGRRLSDLVIEDRR